MTPDQLRELAEALAAPFISPPSFTEGDIRALFDRLDAAEAEIERLRELERSAALTLPGVYYMDPPDGGDVIVLNQIKRMAQDAERYRYLKRGAMTMNAEVLDECDSSDHIIYVMSVDTKVKRIPVVYHGASIPDLDARIDAEIASEGRR